MLTFDTEDSLTVIEQINGWTSLGLGIRFVFTVETLEIYYPDGSPFLTTVELKQWADNAESELKKLRYYLKQ